MRIVKRASGTTSSIPPFASWGWRKKVRKQEIRKLFEKIMTENISILVKEIDIQVQEAQIR